MNENSDFYHNQFKRDLKKALKLDDDPGNSWWGTDQNIGESKREKIFNQFVRTIDLIDKTGRYQPKHENDMDSVHKASKDYLHDIMNKYLVKREKIKKDGNKSLAMQEGDLKKLDEEIFQELELIRIANGKYHEKDWTGFLSRVAHGLFDSSRLSPYTTASLGFTVTLTCALLVTTCLGLAASGPIGWAALAIGAVFMALHVWNVCNKARLPTTAEQTENQIKLLKDWDRIKTTEYQKLFNKQEEIISANNEPLKILGKEIERLEIEIKREIGLANMISDNSVEDWNNSINTCKMEIIEINKAIQEIILNKDGNKKVELNALNNRREELKEQLSELDNRPPDYKNHLDLDQLKKFIVLNEKLNSGETTDDERNQIALDLEKFGNKYSELVEKHPDLVNKYSNTNKEFEEKSLKTAKAKEAKVEITEEHKLNQTDVKEAQANLANYRDKMGYNKVEPDLSSKSPTLR